MSQIKANNLEAIQPFSLNFLLRRPAVFTQVKTPLLIILFKTVRLRFPTAPLLTHSRTFASSEKTVWCLFWYVVITAT